MNHLISSYKLSRRRTLNSISESEGRDPANEDTQACGIAEAQDDHCRVDIEVRILVFVVSHFSIFALCK